MEFFQPYNSPVYCGWLTSKRQIRWQEEGLLWKLQNPGLKHVARYFNMPQNKLFMSVRTEFHKNSLILQMSKPNQKYIFFGILSKN